MRSAILWGACVLVLLLPASCDRQTGAVSTELSGEDLLALAEFASFAMTGPVSATLPLTASSTPEAATHGFDRFPEQDRGEGAWITGRVGVVEVPLLRPRPLTLYLDLEQLPEHPLLYPQRVEVRWNGQVLREVELAVGRATYEVEVAEAYQRFGVNRLQLLPSYRFSPANLKLDLSGESLAVYCHALRVEGGDPVPAAMPTFQGEHLHVPSGSFIAMHLEVQTAPRLLATLSCPAGGMGEVVAVVHGVSGQENVLLRVPLSEIGERGKYPVEVSLPEEGFIALSFHTVSAPGGGEVVWENPRIVQTPVAPPVPAFERPTPPKNIVIILFDTLRADHTGPYGSDVSTPHLDAFARRGVVMTEAFSTSSWTRPAIATMFSALRESAHGVNANDSVLPAEVPWWPQMLQEHGYQTLGVVRNGNISAEWKFDRGFDHLDQFLARHREIIHAYPEPDDQAEHIWDTYIQPFLDRADPDAPKLIYLHELDPHFAYMPQAEPYKSMYLPPVMNNLQLPTPLYIHGGLYLDREDVDWLHANYKGEISAMDAYLAWMLERFHAAGFGEDTLFVFLSDHGEQFMEHGALFHVTHVWDELIRIPLIFSMPGVLPEDARVHTPNSLLDFAPTLLDWFGWEIPAMMQGRSVLPALLGVDHQVRPVPIVAQAKPDIFALVYGQWRLIKDADPKGGGSFVQYELYDVEADPGQQVNLWSTEQVTGLALRAMLERTLVEDAVIRASFSREEGGTISPELLEQLEAIGYVGAHPGDEEDRLDVPENH